MGDAEAIPGGPKIAVSYNGNTKAPEALNVVWAEYTNKNGQEIYHSHSLDGGASWSGMCHEWLMQRTIVALDSYNVQPARYS